MNSELKVVEILRPNPPYNFSLHLGNFTLDTKPTPFIFDKKTRMLKVLVPIEDGLPLIALFRGEPLNPSITILATRHETRAIDWFTKYARIDFDYNEFLNRSRAIPGLYRLAQKYLGVRPGRCMNLYYALLDVVVKQRITLRLSLRIMSRLVQSLGVSRRVGGHSFYWYPSPNSIVEAGVDRLRKLSLTKMKARALVEISLAELEGRLPSLDDAVRNPWETAKELEQLYGVGPWTSKLAIALVHPRFPLGPLEDLAVRRGFSLLLGYNPTPSEIRNLIRDLGDYAGLAMYLVALDYEYRKSSGR